MNEFNLSTQAPVSELRLPDIANALGPKGPMAPGFGLKVPAGPDQAAQGKAAGASGAAVGGANALAQGATNATSALTGGGSPQPIGPYGSTGGLTPGASPFPDAPGSPTDQAAMHAYIAANPRAAVANLAPMPFLAQLLFGRTSGLSPAAWFGQKVLGLGPPGTPLWGGQQPQPASTTPAANAMAAPAPATPQGSPLDISVPGT